MDKKITVFWALSLIIIAIASIFVAIVNIFSLSVPDYAIRIAGIANLIAIPVLAFTTAKKRIETNKSDK